MSKIENLTSDKQAELVTGIGRIALGDLLRRSARRFGNKIALIDEERSIKFSELDAEVNRFANFLLQSGLEPGSKVITFCSNTIDYAVALYAIHKAGLVWVPINTQLDASDISYIAEHAEAKLVIVDDDNYPSAAFQNGIVPLDINILKLDPSFFTGLKQYPDSEPDLAISERDLALIMYTSGTTSRPKGVMHCHLSVYTGMLSNIAEWGVVRDDKILIVLPMFHVAAHALFTTFMSAGATVVLQKKFDPPRCLNALEEHKITFFVGLPLMYEAMLELPNFKEADLSALRLCIYSMAPMAKTLLQRLIKEFCPQFALTSGQTEMYPITVMFRPEQQLERFGNYWGEAALVNDLAIMDDDGNILKDGEVGEIVHRGPNVMLGYYKDPEATAEARKFGWHHTGDLGLIDPDGQLLFIDRKKDIIKTGGENVPSVKVEEVLLRHPDVENSAVLGIPHPRWEEAILACVTLKSNATATEQDLVTYCKTHLGGFEVPKAVKIVKEMPMTATSKLRKVELKAQYQGLFVSKS